MRYLAHLVTGEYVVIDMDTQARGPGLAWILAGAMDGSDGWVATTGGGAVNLCHAVVVTPVEHSAPLPGEDEAATRRGEQVTPEEGDALGRLAGQLAYELAPMRLRGMNGGPFLPAPRRSAENPPPDPRDDPHSGLHDNSDDPDEDPQSWEGERT
jgi:hypothetical protein